MSSGHKIAKILLNELFPNTIIYEEVEMPGTRLYLDFFIPLLPLAIEVQGEQHYCFVPHFHVRRENFFAQLKRDAQKREWLEINSIPLITLNDKDDENVWRRKISDFYSGAIEAS